MVHTLRLTDGTVTHSQIIDPTRDPRWDAFVEGHPAGLVFHTTAWARVLMETYGYQPRYHILENANGAIEAAWPLMLVASRLTGRRLISLPFCDHAPPLVQRPEEAQQLFAMVRADEAELGASRMEVRGWPHHLLPPLPELAPVHYFSSHTLPLSPDLDQVFAGANQTSRRYVRQAQRRGVQVRFAETIGDLLRFHALNVEVRRRLGLLPQPLTFFQAIEQYLLRRGMGHLLLAELNGQTIAGLLCLSFGPTVINPFAVSDQAYWEYRPNHFLLWKSLEWSCLHGFAEYDAGRCGAEDTGLATFKARWGFQQADLPYYYYPQPGGFGMTRPSGPKKLALTAFSRVAPRSLFVLTGRYLYPHLG